MTAGPRSPGGTARGAGAGGSIGPVGASSWRGAPVAAWSALGLILGGCAWVSDKEVDRLVGSAVGSAAAGDDPSDGGAADGGGADGGGADAGDGGGGGDGAADGGGGDGGAVDADGDGHTPPADCDDGDPTVHPGARDLCDGVDDNCSGDESDAEDAVEYHADTDGDRFGDPDARVAACSVPSGHVTDDTDCDDTNPAVNPAATEVCGNGWDDDCDPRSHCRITGGGGSVTGGGAWGPATLTASDSSEVGVGGFAVVDVDGDGWVELMVGDPRHHLPGTRAGRVLALSGPPMSGTESLSDHTAWTYLGPAAGAELGAALATGRGLGGPGVDMLVAGAPGEDLVVLLTGLPSWSGAPDPSASVLTDAPARVAEAGVGEQVVGSAGDLDGDGALELVIGRPGRVLIFAPPFAGALDRSDAAFVVEDLGRPLVGGAVSGGRDHDGDGLDDLLIGGGDDAAWVLHAPTADVTDLDAAGQRFDGVGGELGSAVLLADVDGDGVGDVILADPSDGSVRWFGPAGPGPVAAGAARGWHVGGAGLGASMARGDVDGDGIDDVLVGTTTWASGRDCGRSGDTPGAALFYGDVSRSTWSACWFNSGSCGSDVDQYVGMGAVLGDVDQDGYDDLVMGYAMEGVEIQRAALIFPGQGI